MKKILVALDYGDTCSSVFNRAIKLAKATGADLDLLSVTALENDDSITFFPTMIGIGRLIPSGTRWLRQQV